MILGLRVPPGEGFFSPGLVQFEDLEKNVCKVSIVKHAVSAGPMVLGAERIPRLFM